MVLEATPEYLLNVVDEDTALKIWNCLQGMRIYFSKATIRNYHIIKDYNAMINKYYARSEAIKELSCKYEISTYQIRRITKRDTKAILD